MVLQEDQTTGSVKAGKNDYLEKAAGILAILLTVFQIYTATFGLLGPAIQRAIHLGFALAIIVLSKPLLKNRSGTFGMAERIIFFVLVALPILYVIAEFDNMVMFRVGMSDPLDILFGVILLVVLFEGTRRVYGWPLVIVGLAFIAYAFAGRFMPGQLLNPGYDIERVINQLYMGTEGIWGMALGVSATYIFIFILFGALYNALGGGDWFIKIATALFGTVRGGPTKVAVLASGAFGSISGSAVANVVGTGVFTIPLGKRMGYPAHFAAAVEAMASTGGQFMPPVMGASAFIMAETLGIGYGNVVIAALIPAFLYYFCAFIMVDLEAAKLKMIGLPKNETPEFWSSFKEGWYYFIPPIILIYYLLIKMASPLKSGVIAVYAMLVIDIAVQLVKTKKVNMMRYVNAFKSAGQEIAPIAAACGVLGVIIAMVLMTGMGLKLSSMLVALAGGHLLLLALLTAVTSIILGMGMPTLACYVLLSVLVAPALVSLGVVPLAAHLFVFYYGILSAITPPVALAAYAAAGISGSNPNKVAFTACRLGIVIFILPFFFIQNPCLIMQGSVGEIILSVISATIGCVSLSAGFEGMLFKPLNWAWRIALIVAGLVLLHPNLFTDIVGYGIVAGSFIYGWMSSREKGPLG